MARLDRPGEALVPADGRAGVVGRRPLAAHLVEAVAELGALVVELLDELARVEVGAAVALVVNALAVEHLRTAHAVKRRQAVVREDVGDHARHHFGNRRAAGHEHDGLVRDDLRDRHGVRGIGLGGLHAAPGGAGAPADDGLGARSDVLDLPQEGLAAGNAVHAVVVERHVALNGKDVVALVLLDRVLEGGLGLMTGGGHDRVVVIERDHREHQVLGDRMVAADEGFGAAGAFKAVEPDDRRAGLRLHRLGDVLGARASNPQARGREGAELQEAASGNALTPQRFVLRFKHRIFSGEGLLAALLLRRARRFNGPCV